MRVGIFGGAFNPPHHGHLICAAEARFQLDLDEVRLMPVGEAPHRTLEAGATSQQRLAMARLSQLGQDGIEVTDIELTRPGPSYTVDTLAALKAAEPDNQLTLIIGADQAMSFGNWREPQRIAELAQIAVAARVEHNHQEAVAEVERATAGARPQVFDMPRIDISSTLIRERAGDGQPIAHLVPAGVAELIEEAGLYQ